MDLSALNPSAVAEFVPPADLVIGDVIDFFGEPHTIEALIVRSGPLVDAGLVTADRIAVADGGAWQLTLVSPLVPVLRGAR